MEIKANAKINLCLNVIGKREDGYHDMDMVMIPLTLQDTIYITPAKQDHFTCDDPSCVMNERNTVVRALNLMRDTFNRKEAFHIHLEKRIPMEAGLAGGSSDAAAILRGLRKHWNLNISLLELAELGKQIGADVPFCVMNTCARVQGIGERITPFVSQCDFGILLVKPQAGISTKQGFQRLSEVACEHPDVDACEQALKNDDFVAFCAQAKNTLEASAFSLLPQLAQIKTNLYDMGLPFVLMSGTGSTMFALSKDRAQLRQAAKQLESRYPFVCVCEMLPSKSK